MADLLTEKRDEILSANKKDMELAVNSGILNSIINLPFIYSQMNTCGLVKSCDLSTTCPTDIISVQGVKVLHILIANFTTF